MGVLAYIGLGSNMGDRRAFLEAALGRLRPRRVSRVIETEPWGVGNQPAFLNAVAEVETSAPPQDLLRSLLALETEAGRVRGERWGPRTLDLDLLIYGDRVLRGGELILPHPRLAGRRFVLDGLAELCPDLRVPGLGRTVAELRDALPAGAA